MMRKNNICKKLLLGVLAVSVSLSGIFVQPEDTKVQAASGKVVVTIDPGHGGSEKGAYVEHNGSIVCEKNLNLKIAKYMKKELESYKNITVYLTRTGDSTVSLERRVEIAKNHHSHLLFSVHNNASGDSSTYKDGAFALISSGQYHKELTTVSAMIGSLALQNVSASTGIVNRGYLKRLSGTKKYPNGKPADYYAIVRGGTEAGIPAMIMEHAFMDDEADMNRLDSDAELKKLGIADANAVAHYFGLAKKNGSKKYKKLGPKIQMVSRFWMLKDGKYYYVNSKEKILTGWVKIYNRNYHFEAGGAATKGFKRFDEDYYYFNQFGEAQRGWQKIKKKWYYFRKNGKALRNCRKKIGKKVYRFNTKGVCYKGR